MVTEWRKKTSGGDESIDQQLIATLSLLSMLRFKIRWHRREKTGQNFILKFLSILACYKKIEKYRPAGVDTAAFITVISLRLEIFWREANLGRFFGFSDKFLQIILQKNHLILQL